MKNKHIGSSFDDFLQEEGIREQVEVAAIKKAIAYQIEKSMSKQHMTKSRLAKMMKTSRSALDRLLDPAYLSVTLNSLQRIALALGKKLKIEFA